LLAFLHEQRRERKHATAAPIGRLLTRAALFEGELLWISKF
jgi:hypothetical protein